MPATWDAAEMGDPGEPGGAGVDSSKPIVCLRQISEAGGAAAVRRATPRRSVGYRSWKAAPSMTFDRQLRRRLRKVVWGLQSQSG